MRRTAIALFALVSFVAWVGLSAAEGSAGSGPFVLVLGTAQDGGIPQIGGQAAPDQAARLDPRHRRLVASLMVVDPPSGRRWLIDSTPDVAAQLERADLLAPRSPRTTGAGRPRMLDGIFLSHAHVGHYLGLAWFGREIYGADRLPVHGSRRMTDFLGRNGPWEQLVRLEQITLSTMEPERPVVLAPELAITPFLVPHRDEYTGTFGFAIRGPQRTLLYIPDIDKWERWGGSDAGVIEAWLAKVDIALLDGTFFAADELPGRSLAEVPHPLVIESLARFGKLPETERRKVVFTHLNHSNRAALPETAERAAIVAAGMRVAEEGERIDL